MSNDSQIRAIVQQEVARIQQSQRFNLTNTSRHQHTTTDIAPISANDITPGNSVTGSITFAQQTTYNIGVNFNPSTVVVNGNVIGPSNQRFLTVGTAKFGPSLYLQPNTSTSVKAGGVPETIIQCCSYFGAESSGGAMHTLVDEGHIVDIEYSGTIFARATITGYSNQGIILVVDDLVSGWSMNLNLTIS